MGIPHQAYNCKYIKLSLVFIILFSFISLSAQSYEDLFVVEDIKVDVTADNSVMAQNQAFEKAQVQAFETLSGRMLMDSQSQNFQTPSALMISSLVKDYEVTDEQISAVRYIGTYKFRFRENAVKDFFSGSGVQYTDTKSRPLLVLPVLQKGTRNSLWSEDNVWMQAWSRTKLSAGLVPVEVPIGDLMDIEDIDENSPLNYEQRKLSRMLARYNADEVAIMIAVPDQMLSGIQGADAIAKGALRIAIYRTDRARAEHVKDINVQANGSESVAALYSRAVKFAHQALQKDWKTKAINHASQGQKYSVRTHYKTLREWNQIQKKLKNTPGLSDISVSSMKKTNAMVRFHFKGDEAYLRDVLRRSNFSLQKPQHHVPGDHQKTVTYDLYVGGSSGMILEGVDQRANEGPHGTIHTF